MKMIGVETLHADGGWRPWTFWPSECGMAFRCTGRSWMDVSSSKKSPSPSIRSAKREKTSAGRTLRASQHDKGRAGEPCPSPVSGGRCRAKTVTSARIRFR